MQFSEANPGEISENAQEWLDQYLLQQEFALAYPGLSDWKNRELYRLVLRDLALHFLVSQPALFELSVGETLLAQYRVLGMAHREKMLDRWIAEKKIYLKEPVFSWFDYSLLHLLIQARPGQSLFVVCPADWLDYPQDHFLKVFITTRFRIRTVLTSWTEPWFFKDSFHKILLVLEHKAVGEQLPADRVRFINLTVPLETLGFEEPDALRKWMNNLLELHREGKAPGGLHRIGDHLEFLHTDHFAMRRVAASWLLKQSGNWGIYLRAPAVYFELYEKCRYMLTPLKSVAVFQPGFSSEKEDFYCLFFEKEGKTTTHVRNSSGWKGKIENKYLRPAFSQASELAAEENSAGLLLFVCNRTRAELEKAGDQHTLVYLDYSEQQILAKRQAYLSEDQEVAPLPEQWYFYRFPLISADFLAGNYIEDRFFFMENEKRFLHRAPLIGMSTKKTAVKWMMRSSLFLFFAEAEAPATASSLLSFTAANLAELTVIKPDLIDESAATVYAELKMRSPLPLLEEIAQTDTRKLDAILLESIGLEPNEVLARTTEALQNLRNTRLAIAAMRKRSRRVFHEEFIRMAIRFLFPKGLRRFPEDFCPAAQKNNLHKGQKVEVNNLPVHYQGFMGYFEVKDKTGQILFNTDSKAKADYAQLLSAYGITKMILPEDTGLVHAVVSAYFKYVEEVRQKVSIFLQRRLQNTSLSDRWSVALLREAGLRGLDKME